MTRDVTRVNIQVSGVLNLMISSSMSHTCT